MTDTGRSGQPGSRRPREVVEHGTVEGVVETVLPEVTRYDERLDTILLKSPRGRAQWFCCTGGRPELQDDRLIDKRVRLAWIRYEGGNRRYVDGDITVLAQQPQRPL